MGVIEEMLETARRFNETLAPEAYAADPLEIMRRFSDRRPDLFGPPLPMAANESLFFCGMSVRMDKAVPPGEVHLRHHDGRVDVVKLP